MEYVVLLICVVFVIVVITIKGIYDRRQEHARFIKKMKASFGTFSEYELTEARLERIKKYYLNHKDENWSLDDITWHDLDMDMIFEQMNTTLSSAGEEFLYYLLRTPRMKINDLEEIESLVRFFQENEEQRVNIQDIFHTLGTTGKYSLYDYLHNLDQLGKRSNVPHIVSLVALFVSVALIPFQTMVGILCLVVISIYNISMYFKEKSEIRPYLISFSYVLRLIQCAKDFEMQTDSYFEKYQKQIREDTKALRSFSRNAFITMSMGEASTNPLDILMDYLRMMFHFDLMKFNRMLKSIRDNETYVDSLVTTMGFIESMIVIANYRDALPYYSIPLFGEEVSFEGVIHPLIEKPVSNDFKVKNCVLLTGSNASGKSTFLKTIGVNSILAQTIHTCSAKHSQTRIQKVYSSMKLEDSIEKKESYYMAEIRAIKRILDASELAEIPVLCFVDEVLRGTNTVERIAASTQILKFLAQKKVLCFAATHDIELTKLLEDWYDNYHFTEEIIDQDIFFSYKILQGPAVTRNAILLLQNMGYPSELVEEAQIIANSAWSSKEANV